MTQVELNRRAARVLGSVRRKVKNHDTSIIQNHSRHCAHHDKLVSPAECHDCYAAQPAGLRAFTSREECIKKNNKETLLKSEDFWEDTKGVKPAKKTATPKPKPSAASVPAKVEIGKNDAGTPLAKVGATVEVELEKGQGQVTIKVTKEMAADRDAARAYAVSAAKSQWEAQIKRAVAIALYAGEGNHLPWVIDSQYDSFEQAVKEEFGFSRGPAYSYRNFGRAIIASYGKAFVLKQGEQLLDELKGLGFDKIPVRKIPVLQRGVHDFEQFLKTGRFESSDGKEITVDDICKQGIGQLNLLFEEFTRTSEQRAIAEQEEKNKAAPAIPPVLPLSEKEGIIAATYLLLSMSLEDATRRFAESIQGWPRDAVAVINSSPYVLELQGKVKKWAYAAHLVATMATYDPEGMSERLDFLYNDDLGEIDKIFRQVNDESERFQKERAKK